MTAQVICFVKDTEGGTCMTIQDFLIEAENRVSAYYLENEVYDVQLQQAEVVKANDNRVHGLTVAIEGEWVGRTVYLDDLYVRHESGEDTERIFREVIDRCEDSFSYIGPPVPQAMDLDFDSIRSRLSLRLLGSMNNICYMADRPYIDAGNGLIMMAMVNSDESIMSEWGISVTNGLLRDMIECDKETLLTAAMENTQRLAPPVLVDLQGHICSGCTIGPGNPNYLEDKISGSAGFTGSFMLTNTDAYQGAVALFYPGVMEKISEVLGCGYYILPSSVHELIIVPDILEPDVDMMRATVHEANTTVVERKDLLSDDIFHYDPNEGEIRTVIDEKSGFRTVAKKEDCGSIRKYAKL